MNRAARRLALTAVASAFALTLAVPTALARDSFGPGDGDRMSYPARYGENGHGEYSRDDRYGQGASEPSEDGRGSGRPGGPPGDPGSTSGRDDHASAPEGRADTPGNDTGNQVGKGADERADDQNVSPEELAARARAAERIRRAGIEMALLQQQQMMVVHLERADAFLASMSERIGWSDLDPAPKHALLGMIDERRHTITDLVEQVQAAETAQELEALRPATLDPVGVSQS